MSLASPEEEDHSFFALVDDRNHVVGELLPTLLLVRVRESLSHGQDGV